MKNFFALICAAMIFLTGCSNEQAVEVKTEKVLPADEVTIFHDGKISLSDEQIIRSNISGTVIEIYFEKGQEVTAGQRLLKIGKQDTEIELLQTKAALGESMTALAREMAQRNSVEQLQAEIAELQRRIQILEEESAAGIIYAPVSGQLGINHARLGENVLADETIIATVGRSNPVVVSFEISAEEKNFLATNSPKVSLKLSDGTTYPRAGTINFFDDKTAEATFDNPVGRLLLGDTVQIELDGVKIPNAVLVPDNAILQRDGDNFVFVVDSDKKAALKKISLGGKIGTQFIVNDGLSAGDSVVVEGLNNLREGTPLKNI